MVSIAKNWVELITGKLVMGEDEKMIIEPLERGFGTTLGVALRRILLSSLQGCAITSVKIDGVLHEFSSIPGVKEDLIDVILNLKQVTLKMHEFDKGRLTLNAVGPCVIRAGMIETGYGIEIINKEMIICHLSDGASLNMEMGCSTGKGYVPASQNRTNDDEIGLIPIDSLYSPVKKVSYQVENTRVGQVTDYDRLILKVETDGTITPETAVAFAARIMQEQLQLFINFEEERLEEAEILEELPFDRNLLKKVEELELSVRSQNCLKNDNIIYIGDLVIKTENEMLRTPNFGRKSLNEIKELLSRMGLGFGMEIVTWPPENIEDLSKKYEDPYN